MISLRGYARHRRAAGLPGGTAQAVRKAIESGRLRDSLRDGRIADVELADLEWERHTLDRAPLSGPCRGTTVRWWRILGNSLLQVARRTKRDSRLSARDRRERRKADGLCVKCPATATVGVHCLDHAMENRERSASLARQRKEDRERRLAGAVKAEDVGRELGVGAERVLEWARDGLIPFETQGAKGGRKWFHAVNDRQLTNSNPHRVDPMSIGQGLGVRQLCPSEQIPQHQPSRSATTAVDMFSARFERIFLRRFMSLRRV